MCVRLNKRTCNALQLGEHAVELFHVQRGRSGKANAELQNEGVTCAVCHVKDGAIEGSYGAKTDAHPNRKDARFTDGSGVCRRCHMVTGDNRWNVFMKLPPCGNFAEIEETGKCPKFS